MSLMIEVMWVGCYADDYYHDLDFGPQARDCQGPSEALQKVQPVAFRRRLATTHVPVQKPVTCPVLSQTETVVGRKCEINGLEIYRSAVHGIEFIDHC